MSAPSLNIKLPGLTPRKKQVYPTKRTMNLYYREDRTTRPATLALYGIFVAVLLLACGKLLVIDLWQEVQTEQAKVASLENELTDLRLQLKDYSEVKKEYARYGRTEEEQLMQNRLEVLNLLEDNIGAQGKIDSLVVADSTVSLQISNVTLSKVSSIVQSLENSDIVQSITVNTAAAKSASKEGEKVDATLTVALKPTASAIASAVASTGAAASESSGAAAKTTASSVLKGGK